ncbi:hypothetical protein GT019_08260 [Paenibacillus sp. T1]|uniref:Uncharacterized protein n=1 Tax=Paenibacillus glycinis TaxID=2697035 RepID=A0ABW9XN96_9BACL|nr:hypothetical protein [Paenibacillus glycinis]
MLKPLMRRFEDAETPEAERLTTMIEQEVLSVTEVQFESALNEVVIAILSGDTALFIDGGSRAIVLDSRGWKSRAVEEPQTESIIRGSREGFNEDLCTNSQARPSRGQARLPRERLKPPRQARPPQIRTRLPQTRLPAPARRGKKSLDDRMFGHQGPLSRSAAHGRSFSFAFTHSRLASSQAASRGYALNVIGSAKPSSKPASTYSLPYRSSSSRSARKSCSASRTTSSRIDSTGRPSSPG